MTIDEAIAHAEWAANNCEGECADEHRQLAEWLRELRKRQDVDGALQDERDLFVQRLGDYGAALGDARAENAKLREFAKNAYRHICAQEGYLRGSGYDSFDYFDTVARDLGIEVE